MHRGRRMEARRKTIHTSVDQFVYNHID